MQEILNEPFAIVSFDSEMKLIKVKWLGNQDSNQYRKTFNTALNFAESHKVELFLSDIRLQTIVSPEDRKWFQTVAMPRAIGYGLKRAAVVFSGNVFKRYYVNNIMDTISKFGIPMKFFPSEEEAISWLRNS